MVNIKMNINDGWFDGGLNWPNKFGVTFERQPTVEHAFVDYMYLNIMIWRYLLSNNTLSHEFAKIKVLLTYRTSDRNPRALCMV